MYVMFYALRKSKRQAQHASTRTWLMTPWDAFRLYDRLHAKLSKAMLE